MIINCKEIREKEVEMYCEECGSNIEEPNDFGDFICEDCEVYCDRCGDYCFQESNDGMCEDCYEDYLDDLEEDED